jgi:3-hydroxy-2-methylpyridine-4,5-dicarboxylate 4-decarboxylase
MRSARVKGWLWIKAAVAFGGTVVLLVVLAGWSLSYAQSPYTVEPKTAGEAIEQVVWANRILVSQGIFDYLGHVSVRNPENPKTFFISRGIAPETVTRRDILEVDLEGKVVTKTSFTPYKERIIHAAIYKARPDVNAVVHAHPIQVVTLSVSEVPLRIVAHPASVFYEGVPNYDGYDFTSPSSTGMLVESKEEGDRVAQTLGKCMGMLMRGHGCNVVGGSVPHAVRNTISLRDNVVIQLGAQPFGKVKGLTYEEAKAAARALGGPERGWNAWVSRVKKEMPDMPRAAE